MGDDRGKAAYVVGPETEPCPYCGLTDHTGREHFQFAMSLSDEEQP